MQFLDYIPALLAFTFAVLGIVARTKDDSKTGIGRVTKAGWLFLSLSAISLALGAYTVWSKQKALEKRASVSGIVRSQLVDGLNAMLRPLCGVEKAFVTQDTSELFVVLRSDENLNEVAKMRVMRFQGSGGRIVSQISSLPYRDFDHFFELNDYYITEGIGEIEHAISSFGGYLSDDEIIAISSVLSDPFLKGDYILSGLTTTYFAQGVDDEQRTGEESRWLKVGTYWFRNGDQQPVLGFLERTETAVAAVLSRSPNTVLFNPCQR